VQAAQLMDQFITGTHMQMVGVAQLYLAFQFSQVIGGNRPLDRPAGGDIHECGRLHRSVRGLKHTPAGIAAF